MLEIKWPLEMSREVFSTKPQIISTSKFNDIKDSL